jgi:hypothetical protein
MNDMSQVIIPKSDQWNADDFIAGPQTFTIREVRINAGSEQPVNIVLEGTEKFYRPCKSMSRVLVGAWGADASKYVGRSLTLYRDPEVKWGGLAVGGIRISHMSDLDSEKTMVLTATKGSRKPFKIKPLVNAPRSQPSDFSGQLAELRAIANPATWMPWGRNGRRSARMRERRSLPNCPPSRLLARSRRARMCRSMQPEAAATRTLGEQLGLDDPHPGEAKAAEILAEIGDCISTLDVTALVNRHKDDIAAMPDELGVKIEVAADKRRNAIEAERAKAGAREGMGDKLVRAGDAAPDGEISGRDAQGGLRHLAPISARHEPRCCPLLRADADCRQSGGEESRRGADPLDPLNIRRPAVRRQQGLRARSRSILMKRSILIAATLPLVLANSGSCSSDTDPAAARQAQATRTAMNAADREVGMPRIKNFAQRKLLKNAYEDMDQTTLTYVYTQHWTESSSVSGKPSATAFRSGRNSRRANIRSGLTCLGLTATSLRPAKHTWSISRSRTVSINRPKALRPSLI